MKKASVERLKSKKELSDIDYQSLFFLPEFDVSLSFFLFLFLCLSFSSSSSFCRSEQPLLSVLTDLLFLLFELLLIFNSQRTEAHKEEEEQEERKANIS